MDGEKGPRVISLVALDYRKMYNIQLYLPTIITVLIRINAHQSCPKSIDGHVGPK